MRRRASEHTSDDDEGTKNSSTHEGESPLALNRMVDWLVGVLEEIMPETHAYCGLTEYV